MVSLSLAAEEALSYGEVGCVSLATGFHGSACEALFIISTIFSAFCGISDFRNGILKAISDVI